MLLPRLIHRHSLKPCLHWQSFSAIMPATVTIVLALATLGGAAQIGSCLFFVALSKVAKASAEVTVT